MIQPVDRFDLDALLLVVLEHVERNDGAGGALRIELAVEIREMGHRLAVDAENHVAALEPGPVGGAPGRHGPNEQMAAHFPGPDPPPTPPPSPSPPPRP